MAFDTKRIRSAIQAAVQTRAELPEAVARDIAFHMTDWLDDLYDYHEFCEAPDTRSSEAIEKLLIDFLVHVPNHLAAASKLLTGIPVTDIFGVGATSEDDESDG